MVPFLLGLHVLPAAHLLSGEWGMLRVCRSLRHATGERYFSICSMSPRCALCHFAFCPYKVRRARLPPMLIPPFVMFRQPFACLPSARLYRRLPQPNASTRRPPPGLLSSLRPLFDFGLPASATPPVVD